jgi:hypothetical protein
MNMLFCNLDFQKLASDSEPQSDWAMASIKSEDSIPEGSLLASASFEKEDPNHVGF